jgi:hypothetical protein
MKYTGETTFSSSGPLVIETIGDKHICIKGVGKLFFQDGFPISLSVDMLKKKGIHVSILHVADECMKNDWTPKTTFNKIKADFEDDINKSGFDINLLSRFCFSDYETQREMLFQYLFGVSTDDVRNGNSAPMDWLKSKI